MKLVLFCYLFLVEALIFSFSRTENVNGPFVCYTTRMQALQTITKLIKYRILENVQIKVQKYIVAVRLFYPILDVLLTFFFSKNSISLKDDLIRLYLSFTLF